MSEAAFRHGDAEKASDTVARESGRYAIEQEGESLAPQPSAAVESIPEAVMTPSAAAPAVSGRAPAGSYDLGIHALSQEELSWIESRASQRPSNDTAMPARAVFAKEGE
jgi:hypothetical protein